jgi:nitrate reductase gamma subunit
MNAEHAWQIAAFVILPYVALTTFVVGHVWRYRFDRFGWTSRSSQLYERRLLLVGGPLFHYGTILAILGHAAGLLVPKSWTTALGVPEWLYADFAKAAGTLAAVLIIIGLAILTFRRAGNDRVRIVTSAVDWVVVALLWAMIVLGTLVTIGYNVLGPGYDYRASVSLWLRGIFSFNPNIHDIAVAPWIFQVHATVAWLFLALFPFTRFVHFWSTPVWYVTRPFVVYRRRTDQRVLSPGESRAWQTFGRVGGGPRI